MCWSRNYFASGVRVRVPDMSMGIRTMNFNVMRTRGCQRALYRVKLLLPDMSMGIRTMNF